MKSNKSSAQPAENKAHTLFSADNYTTLLKQRQDAL